MKIYTYYHDIGHEHEIQLKLIDAWRKSWEKSGFEPCVLGLEDAQKFPGFEKFRTQMGKASWEISNKELKPYGLHCWYRWLAVASLPEKEPICVSDYDVINRGVPSAYFSQNEMTFWFGACPCLASGKVSEFENLVKEFLEISMARKEELKRSFEQLQLAHYHDQEFFQLNLFRNHNKESFKSLREKIGIQLEKPEWAANFSLDASLRDQAPIVHVAHSSFGRIGLRASVNPLRALVAKLLSEEFRIDSGAKSSD